MAAPPCLPIPMDGTSTLETFKTRDVRSRAAAEVAGGLGEEAEVANVPTGMTVPGQKPEARRKNHQPSPSRLTSCEATAAGGGHDGGVPVEEADVIEDEPDIKHPCDHLRRYRTFGWTPSLTLTDDENYMDLVAVVTKNATCCGTCGDRNTCGDREDGRRNQISCVLVNPALLQRNTWALNSDEGIYDDSSEGGRTKYLERRLYGAIIGVSTDIAMFKGMTDGNDGKVHAEMSALGEANRRGNFTEGCTAYVTASPCTNCFGSLVVSGAKRIVSVGRPCEMVGPVAAEREVEMVDLGPDLSAAADIRMAALMRAWDQGAEERAAEVLAQRQRKKEEGEARKAKRDKRKRKRREEKRRHEEENWAEFLG